MKVPSVIVFVGTVGAGKTTQIKLLASELRRRGLKVKITFLKTNHLLASTLIMILQKILTKAEGRAPIRALLEDKPIVFKRIFKLWIILDLFSLATKFLLTIFTPLKMGYTVIIEEYIPATISDYIFLNRYVKSSLKTLSLIIRILLKLMYAAGPAQAIFLDADDLELKTRWKARRGLEERPDYIHMQRTMLLSLSRELSFPKLIYVNGDYAPKIVHEMIMKSFDRMATILQKYANRSN